MKNYFLELDALRFMFGLKVIFKIYRNALVSVLQIGVATHRVQIFKLIESKIYSYRVKQFYKFCVILLSTLLLIVLMLCDAKHSLGIAGSVVLITLHSLLNNSYHYGAAPVVRLDHLFYRESKYEI